MKQHAQAAGEWLEQVLLWGPCLGDHITQAVLSWEVPRPIPEENSALQGSQQKSTANKDLHIMYLTTDYQCTPESPDFVFLFYLI